MEVLQKFKNELKRLEAKAVTECEVQDRIESSIALKQQRFMNETFRSCLDEGDTLEGQRDYFHLRRKDSEGYLRDIVEIQVKIRYDSEWNSIGSIIHLSAYSSNDTSIDALTRAITIGKLSQVLKNNRDTLIIQYNNLTKDLKANLRLVSKGVWATEAELKAIRGCIVKEKVNIVMREMREGKDIENKPVLWITNNDSVTRVINIKIISTTSSGKSHKIEVKQALNDFNSDKGVYEDKIYTAERTVRNQNLIAFIKQHVTNDKA